MKKHYAVKVLISETISLSGQRMRMTDADLGIVGVMPVFASKRRAVKYADGEFDVIEIVNGNVEGER